MEFFFLDKVILDNTFNLFVVLQCDKVFGRSVGLSVILQVKLIHV